MPSVYRGSPLRFGVAMTDLRGILPALVTPVDDHGQLFIFVTTVNSIHCPWICYLVIPCKSHERLSFRSEEEGDRGHGSFSSMCARERCGECIHPRARAGAHCSD